MCVRAFNVLLIVACVVRERKRERDGERERERERGREREREGERQGEFVSAFACELRVLRVVACVVCVGGRGVLCVYERGFVCAIACKLAVVLLVT